ncbi:uncharacterized protein mlip isoform X5 [Sparus aurata]|uniref:uncharacterized protein mlip isoform X5 n=1 Tax=Sparus aurata TaxID=8175 RepID=UPI0011C0E22F|nr:muscular LMNA-interacting protein isoform X5 [Sparus aurata]
MDTLNKSLEKVSTGVPSKPSIFTFMPVVRKLPIEAIITQDGRSGALTGRPHKNIAASHVETTAESMSDEEFFKAEKVFIKECVEGGAGNMIQTGTKLQFKPSPDHVSLSQTKASPSVDARSQNTSNHVTAGTASMETAVDKHRDISRRPCPDASRHAEVSSGFFANRLSEDRASPTDSGDMFPTPASSRESILSERSWSAAQVSSVTSPVSFSRTVSPCSSVLSGVFSPAVVQIKRHFLAPGSSLIHLPQTCFSSCESLSSSVCPQSPPPRHRPPLTRLSLLTAILRKGRLPVLSAALQRPYTPCWPVNPVTLSFCNACSAASSVASIPLELSSQFSSSASIDSQNHIHREPNRCVTAPLFVQSNELNAACSQTQPKGCLERIRSSSAPRWEQTHKIKLSYKSLAAIPTNTLLLDQQAIDEQVERGESPCDMTDGGVTLDRGVVDTHAEMCSPAQLRQQSEELYAVIDEILANSIPESKASRSLQSSRSSTPGLQQNTSSSPKSLGRETKYASLCSLHPPTSLERNLIDRKKTKPGVIRPMTAIPRLTVDDEEEFHPNPFRQFNDKRTFTDNSKVVARKDLHTSSKGRMWREERKPERRTPFSVCDLQITEPEDQISRPVKTSFSPTEGRLEAFETHI